MKRRFEMDVTMRPWKAHFLLHVLVMFICIRTSLADQVLFACNFENNCINYLEQDQNDDIDFVLGEGWEGEWLTGPETDFTFRNKSGHYYYIDANGDSVQMGDRAIIHLPELQRRFYEGLGRLSFAYHMYDGYSSRDQMGTLNVYLRCDDYFNVTFSVGGDQGEDWHFAEIPIECDEEPVQISFEGVRRGIQSDIAIDNIKFIDIFEGSPLPPATQSPGSGRSSSSWSTTVVPGGGRPSVLDTTLFPGGGVISGRTTLPGGTGGITMPPDGDPALKEKPDLNIIVPVSIAALVLLILIIILIAVLLVHKRRKTTKTGELAESPSQLYENNIFSEPSPDRKYESLQGPLNDSNRIYEELHHKKPELRPNGVTDSRCHTAGRMNGHVPPQLRRSMPELGNNFYDPIGNPISINNNARCDNYRNNYMDRSNTYNPGRVSCHSNQEDHPYFTLMPDVVSSTAYQDDRIVFTIPPPPSSTPPPLPPPPRDYDYGRPIEHDVDIDDDDIQDANVYHDVLDVCERRPRSMNSDFEDDDDLGRHRMAVDMDMDNDLRLTRERIPHDLDIDMEIDMQMAEEGAVDIHGLDTLKMTRELERERRARDLEIERNLDRPHRRVGGSVDRRRDPAAHYDYDDDSTRRYPPPYSHHIEEDATGHIRMVNLNYNPSVVHV